MVMLGAIRSISCRNGRKDREPGYRSCGRGERLAVDSGVGECQWAGVCGDGARDEGITA